MEEYCTDVLDSMKKYVIRIRTSGLDNRSYDREYDTIVDKFYEMKSTFRRATADFTENYRLSLNGYDNKMYQTYVEESAKYEQEMRKVLERANELKSKDPEKPENNTEEKTDNDSNRLPDEPII